MFLAVKDRLRRGGEGDPAEAFAKGGNSDNHLEEIIALNYFPIIHHKLKKSHCHISQLACDNLYDKVASCNMILFFFHCIHRETGFNRRFILPPIPDAAVNIRTELHPIIHQKHEAGGGW